jgi:hypothetical protein
MIIHPFIFDSAIHISVLCEMKEHDFSNLSFFFFFVVDLILQVILYVELYVSKRICTAMLLNHSTAPEEKQ